MNGAGYGDPEMDALWDEALRELDEGRRAGIYRRIQRWRCGTSRTCGWPRP